jgi:transcriptional regulator with XRE-family HTH domain
MSSDNNVLGKRIKQLREEKGLLQKDIAGIIGITDSAIGHYERGARFPDPETLRRLAEYFGVSVDYLLGRTDVRNPTQPWHPAITQKDEKDIAKDLERIMNDLTQADGLMFYNEPMTDEDKQLIREAIEFGLKIAKVRNKERFTPKKYRQNKK